MNWDPIQRTMAFIAGVFFLVNALRRIMLVLSPAWKEAWQRKRVERYENRNKPLTFWEAIATGLSIAAVVPLLYLRFTWGFAFHPWGNYKDFLLFLLTLCAIYFIFRWFNTPRDIEADDEYQVKTEYPNWMFIYWAFRHAIVSLVCFYIASSGFAAFDKPGKFERSWMMTVIGVLFAIAILWALIRWFRGDDDYLRG